MLQQQHPRDRALAQINELFEQELGTREKLRVLEAGCGSISHLAFPGETHLVGIDHLGAQLRKNTYLDEGCSSLFEDNKQQTIRKKLRVDGARWRFIQGAVRLMTLGKIETACAQCIFVFQKPPADRPPEARP